MVNGLLTPPMSPESFSSLPSWHDERDNHQPPSPAYSRYPTGTTFVTPSDAPVLPTKLPQHDSLLSSSSTPTKPEKTQLTMLDNTPMTPSYVMHAKSLPNSSDCHDKSILEKTSEKKNTKEEASAKRCRKSVYEEVIGDHVRSLNLSPSEVAVVHRTSHRGSAKPEIYDWKVREISYTFKGMDEFEATYEINVDREDEQEAKAKNRWKRFTKWGKDARTSITDKLSRRKVYKIEIWRRKLRKESI